MGKDKLFFFLTFCLTFIKTIFSISASLLVGITLQTTFTTLRLEDGTQGDINQLIVLLSIGFLIYFLYALLYYFELKIVLQITYKLGRLVKEKLFFKVNRLPFTEIETKLVGQLLSTATVDSNTFASNLSFVLSNIFTFPAMVLCSYIGMFIISPYLTLIASLMIFLTWVINFFVTKLSVPKFRKKQEILTDINGQILENLENRKVIKMFHQFDNQKKQHNKLGFDEFKVNQQAENIIGFIWPVNDLFSTILAPFITVVAITFTIFNIPSGSLVFKTLNIGNVVSFGLLTYFLMAETANAFKLIGVFQKLIVSYERIKGVLDLDEFEDKGNLDISKIETVKFKDLSFSYSSNKKVLNRINFTIRKNSTTAIVGPTGSGKSTIISLLCRFYEYNEGEIYLNDISLKDIKRSCLMDNISLVSQDIFLFQQTILENLRYGNRNATRSEVIEAAKKSNAHSFIKHLKDGYDTLVTSDIEFSSGQIQLLSIARAILSPSSILILDEATSYIDSQTEKDIQDAIENLAKYKMVIVIAHRLSTIKNADQIIVLKDGEIIEIGNHKKLLANKGFYYQLHESNYVATEE